MSQGHQTYIQAKAVSALKAARGKHQPEQAR